MGKSEEAAKPQTEDKEPENSEKETQNTGKKSHRGYYLHLGLIWLRLIFVFLRVHLHFLDSAPVNGDSQEKKDDMEVKENPKSPANEENNDDTASSPIRYASHVNSTN